MATTDDAWKRVERWAKDGGSNDRCILELRARVEALEQRAAAPEPAPAPAADRPLWAQMEAAYGLAKREYSATPARYAAEIDAVADWLSHSTEPGLHLAAEILRTEARRAREEA